LIRATNDSGYENDNNETEKQMFNFDFVNTQQPELCNLGVNKKIKTKIPKLNLKGKCDFKCEKTNHETEIDQEEI